MNFCETLKKLRNIPSWWFVVLRHGNKSLRGNLPGWLAIGSTGAFQGIKFAFTTSAIWKRRHQYWSVVDVMSPKWTEIAGQTPIPTFKNITTPAKHSTSSRMCTTHKFHSNLYCCPPRSLHPKFQAMLNPPSSTKGHDRSEWWEHSLDPVPGKYGWRG